MLDSRGFDLWADGYDVSVGASDGDGTYPFAGYKDVLGRIYGEIRSGAGRRVLDAGLGTGTLARRLYGDGYEITGIDFSPRMLELAREKMPRAELVCYDLTRGLPDELGGRSFDFIVCTYAIHHLNDAETEALIRDFLDSLAPEGRLFIGDVSFATEAELDLCRRGAGGEWDEEENYPVAEKLRRVFPSVTYEKLSCCAGLFTLRA